MLSKELMNKLANLIIKVEEEYSKIQELLSLAESIFNEFKESVRKKNNEESSVVMYSEDERVVHDELRGIIMNLESALNSLYQIKKFRIDKILNPKPVPRPQFIVVCDHDKCVIL